MAGTSYTRQSTLTDGDTITASLFNAEYNQLVTAFSYAATGTTGHQHDGGAGEGGNIEIIGDQDFLNKIVVDSTNNRWGFFVEVSSSAVEQVRIQDGAIVPVTDSDIDLGTTSLRFKDTYTDTITTTGNVAVGGNLTVTGNATIAGNLTFGDAASDTVAFSADIASHLLPSADATYDLGATGSEWNNLFIDGTANIDSLVADTADINGGTIDGAVIGGSSAAAGSFTTVGATGNITVGGTVDGRDVATDGTKLDGIEASADVTDTTNVTAAGALMDSELTAIASVKALNQGVATGDSPTFVDVTATSLDISGDVDVDGTLETDALTIAGVTLAETISDTVGAMVASNTETGVTVTYDDADNTLDFVIGADAIVQSMIADDAIDSQMYVDGSIDTVHIADDAVTGAKLANNIDVAGTLDVTGVLTADSNVIVAGNLTVNGTTTTLNTASLDVEDKNITINYGSGDTTGSANGAGITIQDAVDASTDATILWDTTNDEFDFSHPINVAGKVTSTGTSVFASLDISGDIDVDGTTNLDVVDIDGAVDMASTLQVDGAATFTTEITANGGIALGDSDIATFGASDDLQIYHNGSHSFIKDVGTGNLYIDATSLYVRSATGEPYIVGTADAGVSIYHNNAVKLATTATGIDVTGTATMDGLTVSNSTTNAYKAAIVESAHSTTDAGILFIGGGDNEFGLQQPYNAAGLFFYDRTNGAKRLDIGSGGDISFYEDTGTTAKFFWDASAESLGIGTSSPLTGIDLRGTSASAGNTIQIVGNSVSTLLLGQDADGGVIRGQGGNNALKFYTGGTGDSAANASGTERMRIDSSGNMGIGVVPEAWTYFSPIQAKRSSFAGSDGQTGVGYNWYYDGAYKYIANDYALAYQQNASSGVHSWSTAASGTADASISWSERMRIDSSGNVGIGTSSPSSYYSTTLVVDAPDEDGITVVSPTTGTGYLMFADGTSGNEQYRGYINYGHANDDMQFATSGLTRMRIDSSGNVGIGESNPQFNLHIKGSGDTGIQLTKDGVIASRVSAVTSGLSFGVDGANGTTERMRIDSSGNVGIGEASPARPLHVSTSGVIPLRLTSTGTDCQIELGNSGGTPIIGSFNDQLIFNTASTERMRIDSAGNVGIGTSSPTANTILHLKDTDAQIELESTNGSNSAFIDFDGTNLQLSTNRNMIDGAFSNTGKSAAGIFLAGPSGGSHITFATASANNTTPTERMRIDSSGNLLVGYTASDGIGGAPSDNNFSELGKGYINLNRDDTATARQVQFGKNGNVAGYIQTAGSSTSYVTSSDQRLKENIADADDAGSKVDAIQVRKYDWKADGSHQDYGMIAQELQTVAPEAVSGDADSEEMMGVDYSKLVPMLIKEIQSLRNRVAQLEE